MTWSLLLGLSSGLCWGAADFVGGLQSRRLPSLAVTLWSQLVGGLVLLSGGHLIIPGKSYAKGLLRAQNSTESRSKALGRSRGAFARASAALVRMA